MKVSTRRKAIFGGLFFLVILCIVWVNQNKTGVKGLGEKTATNDSLYNTFDQLPKGKYEAEVAREHLNAYYSGNMERFNQILSYFEKRAEKEHNTLAKVYIISNKASILLSQNNPDSALILGLQAYKQLDGEDDIVLGNVYNCIANSYYFLGKLDSAKYYMTKGFVFANTYKIDAFITKFGINLGTLNYTRMLYGAASYYFSVALEAAKRQNDIPLMLINNITTILSVQHRYKAADSLWNIYLSAMQKEKDPYQRQLFFLNRVLHLQNMGRLKESRVIYSEYHPEDIFEVLQVPYLHAVLNQAIYDQKEQAYTIFNKHRHWIGERYVPAVSELYNELTELIEANPSLLPMDTIVQWEKNYQQQLIDDPKAASHSNRLKSLIAKKRGNIKLAFQFLEESKLNDETFEKINDSLRHADFVEKNELSKLKEEINVTNLKVEQAERDNRYVNYLWMLSILVLICFIIALLFALSYRKTKLDYATEQINFMKAEEEYLTKEQDLNIRIVNLSQLIVLKAQDLGKKIKLVGSDDKEALHEVKKQIDELSRLGIEEKPQLADKLMDSHQTVFSKFPDFAENGNLTEKRIFILSIDGYKPKEIANVVGVSIQYVHNVRTRLRKKLNIDNNTEWESLKKM